MNYCLQVVKGRSAVNTLRLMEGVNSVGRHDDCLIRIRSSQVSRRHCEIVPEGDALIVRDLGSSNGTYVNGKRVLGKQALQPGDVLTIGGVTLRVDLLSGAAGTGAAAKAPKPAPHDTAEVEALPIAEEDLELEMDEEEFEIAIDDEPEQVDIIPLDDEPPPPGPSAKSADKKEPGKTPDKDKDDTATVTEAPKPQSSPEEEDAVAQFLMDLKLDEDD
jgi:pSer/pThr/pTyr-binding forkhead associated (FHA) protein